MDPKADARQTLDEAMKRISTVEEREKEIARMVSYNNSLLDQDRRSIQSQISLLRNEILDSKDKIDDIARMIKLISKEFRMVAKKEELRKVERKIESMMAANLISRKEAQKFIDSENL